MTWQQLVDGAKESPPARIKKAVSVDVHGKDGETLRIIAHFGRGIQQHSEEYFVRCAKADVTPLNRNVWFESLD